MMTKLLALYKKHGVILRYLVIGGLTTVIDIATFTLFDSVIGMHHLIANIFAWVAAVAFAFVGNKWIVFQTKTDSPRALAREAVSFTTTRVLTLLLSEGFLALAIDVLGMDNTLSKTIATVIVIVLNYILSRLLVFTK